MRVADVDRHPPPALLGQAVGVDAGQGAQQRGLAVVDVAGRADDDGHAHRAEGPLDRRRQSPSSVRVHGPEVEHDPAVLDPADDRWLPAPGAPRAAASAIAAAERQPDRRQGLAGQRPAADGRAQRPRPRRRRAEPRRERLGPRAELLGRRGDHPPDRDVASSRDRPGTGRASPRRPAIVTLSGRMARASGSRRIRADEVRPADDESGLRPADELVAAERDDVGARGQPLAGHRLVRQAVRAPCRGAPRARGRR